jgi:protein SCO1/2
MAAFADVRLENRQGGFIEPSRYQFEDDTGKSHTLSEYFSSQKPVLISFIYFECPGACTVLLNELISGLTPHILLPGKDLELVVISINPNDTPVLAKKKKETYLTRYGRKDTEAGWHFLTGKESQIRSLTEQLGFYYESDPAGVNFNHPSALYFLSSNGVISGIMNGLRFPGNEVRSNLVTAKQSGKGTLLGTLGSYCLTFLPHQGWLDRPSRWLLLFLSFLAVGGALNLLLKIRNKSQGIR